MKKFAALTLSAALAVTAMAFAACDSDDINQNESAPEISAPSSPSLPEISEPPSPALPSSPSQSTNPAEEDDSKEHNVRPLAFGEIDGDYVEVAPADYARLFGGLNADLIFGNPDQSDGFGLEYKFNSQGGIELAYKDLIGIPRVYGFNAGFGADYKLLVSSGGVGLCGAGLVFADISGDVLNYFDQLSVYNDPYNIYIGNDDSGIKASLGGILGAITGNRENGGQETEQGAESPSQPEPDINLEIGGDIDILSAVNALAEAGVKIYADLSDGIKIKLTIDSTAALDILNADYVPEEYSQIIRESLTFSMFRLDVYFALNAQGGFAKAGYTYTTEFSVNIPSIESIGLPAAALGIKESGGAEITAFTGEITLPDNLENYYDVFSLSAEDISGYLK